MHMILGLTIDEWGNIFTILSILGTGIGILIHYISQALDKNVKRPVTLLRSDLKKLSNNTFHRIGSLDRRVTKLESQAKSQSERIGTIENHKN